MSIIVCLRGPNVFASEFNKSNIVDIKIDKIFCEKMAQILFHVVELQINQFLNAPLRLGSADSI